MKLTKYKIYNAAWNQEVLDCVYAFCTSHCNEFGEGIFNIAMFIDNNFTWAAPYCVFRVLMVLHHGIHNEGGTRARLHSSCLAYQFSVKDLEKVYSKILETAEEVSRRW